LTNVSRVRVAWDRRTCGEVRGKFGVESST